MHMFSAKFPNLCIVVEQVFIIFYPVNSNDGGTQNGMNWLSNPICLVKVPSDFDFHMFGTDWNCYESQ